MRRFTALVAALVVALGLSTANAAMIIFDDFNTNFGHFAQSPNFSGTTNILKANPSANATTRTTTLPAEGTHSLNIRIEGGGQMTPAGFPRIRFLSGGGTVANNTSFTPTAGTDGFIGFLYKVPAPGSLPGSLPAGLQLHINTEGSGGAAADGDSGVARNAIMDGQWHLVEWNLDAPADWIGFPGVGGDGVINNGVARTIDSIYFRYPTSAGWTGYTGIQDLQIDYVVKSDSGSIATLVTPTVGDANLGQLLRNVETQDLGPLSSTNPLGGALTWSLVSIVAPGPFEIADFVVDPVTGLLDFNSIQEELGTYQVTLKATNGAGFSDTGVMTFEVIIPEPATFTLLGLAMIGLVGVFRRR